jgi:hypothetical protein
MYSDSERIANLRIAGKITSLYCLPVIPRSVMATRTLPKLLSPRS